MLLDVTPVLEAPLPQLPAEAADLLHRAAVLEGELSPRLTGQPPGGFHGSDYGRVYAALHSLRQAPALRGRTFCEWGSGSGVVTLLAAGLGFQAFGIEIQSTLVALSKELSAGSAADGLFACGSFVPHAVERQWNGGHQATFLASSGQDGHDLLQLDPGAVDVVYSYPWPGEESYVQMVFEHCATPGALLLTYHGTAGFQLHEKTAEAG